jgi:CheY-like chemotaxis protein
VRVLVVEDEERLAAGLRAGLEAEGFAVDVAVDGPEGVWRAGIPHFAERDRDHEVPVHATVPERDRVPGSLRHELSSLQGPHALAPDTLAVGEELVDPDVVEVPIGSSSDPSFAGQLSHSKRPQPYTTGAALLDGEEPSGALSEVQLAAPVDAPEVTAQPSHRPPAFGDEHYDAIAPESAGLEWLSRATQSPYAGGGEDGLDDLHVEDEVGAAAISEGSFEAGLPHELLDEETDEFDDERYEEQSLREEWSRPDPTTRPRSVRPEPR